MGISSNLFVDTDNILFLVNAAVGFCRDYRRKCLDNAGLSGKSIYELSKRVESWAKPDTFYQPGILCEGSFYIRVGFGRQCRQIQLTFNNDWSEQHKFVVSMGSDSESEKFLKELGEYFKALNHDCNFMPSDATEEILSI